MTDSDTFVEPPVFYCTDAIHRDIQDRARAEATAAAEQRLRERIEALPRYARRGWQDGAGMVPSPNGLWVDPDAVLALLDAPAPRETFRDHETCVPHDHAEPDSERWERDQAASLAGLTHGDWCEQTIRPTEHADTDSAFLHNDHCRDSRAASPRQGEPVEGHDPEAKCRTCGHREHDHHHSADPRWCGADFAMLGFTACPCPGYAALSEPAEAGEP